MNRSPQLRDLVLTAAVALAALVPACGKNGEGERCERDNIDVDCTPPLVCTPGYLIGQSSDLCCPADIAAASDPRCRPNTATTGTGGTGGDGGTGGSTTTGMGGTTTAGGGAGGGGTGGSTATAGAGGTGGATTNSTGSM